MKRFTIKKALAAAFVGVAAGAALGLVAFMALVL